MLIGAMNHPHANVLDELRWMAEMRLDFIDLTIEPPQAAAWTIDRRAIARALLDTGLKVVGHTAYYLPLASPFESIRKAAVAEVAICLEILAELGAKWMNLHPDRNIPMHTRGFVIARNLESLHELLPISRQTGVGIMLENLPEGYNTAAQMGELLDPIPELGLHLDIGHANLLVPRNTTDDLLKTYGNRLRHVHLHDNKGGGADLHLPLGGGTLDVPKALKALKSVGYDGTITLEVFTPDRHYLAYSRDMLRKYWDEA